MKARAIICLLALAFIMAGAEAVPIMDLLGELKGGVVINTMEISATENISINVEYPWVDGLNTSSKLTLDPRQEYVIIVVKKKDEDEQK